jgi:hypothetical protein
MYNCTDSVSTDRTYDLQGSVRSEYDGSVVVNTEVLLGGVVVDTTDSNGRFSVLDLPRGDYRFRINAIPDHKPITINRVSLYSSDIILNLQLPLKFNLIESILSSTSVSNAQSLIRRFEPGTNSAVFDDDSMISLTFEEHISASDTIEFAYYHEQRIANNFEGEVLFEHALNLNFIDTDFDENLIIENYNDEVVRTIRYYPTILGADSTRELNLRIVPNSNFQVEELNLLYFTSY